jgi:hypothetical protein
MGNEKTEAEIRNIYEQKIKELQEKLELTEEMAILQEKELKIVNNRHHKLYVNHQYFLRRKELYKVKEGNCVYLCDMNGLREEKREDEIKFGGTKNVNQRMADFRTAAPFCKLLFVLYTPNHMSLEAAIKTRYEEELTLNNHEHVSQPFEMVRNTLIQIEDLLRLKYTVLDDEEITNFNENTIPKKLDELDAELPEGTQRCGGRFHETEESRILTFDKFFKNKASKNGVNRLCKQCYLRGVYGDDRKQRKVVAIPKFDCTTHKWCNLCETVKEHADFYKANYTKDGLNPNCKACKANQKKDYLLRKKMEKESPKIPSSVFASIPCPVDAPGEWVPREEFLGRKSFGWFSCNKCNKSWVSAHAQCIYTQGCKRCETKSYPIYMWKNEGRKQNDETKKIDTIKPHDSKRCEACKKGDCTEPDLV